MATDVESGALLSVSSNGFWIRPLQNREPMQMPLIKEHKEIYPRTQSKHHPSRITSKPLSFRGYCQSHNLGSLRTLSCWELPSPFMGSSALEPEHTSYSSVLSIEGNGLVRGLPHSEHLLHGQEQPCSPPTSTSLQGSQK